MSYDYKKDVLGSAVRCDRCGTYQTRGTPCEACKKRLDELVEELKKTKWDKWVNNDKDIDNSAGIRASRQE